MRLQPLKSQSLRPEDNLGLVYMGARRAASFYGGDHEEYLGPAYEILLDAIRTYNPSLGYRLSTHVMRAMQWKLLEFHRREMKNQKRRNSKWLSAPLSLVESFYTSEDQPPAESPAWLGLLNPRELDVLRLYSNGSTYEKIGLHIGVSREMVRQIILSIRKKVSVHLKLHAA